MEQAVLGTEGSDVARNTKGQQSLAMGLTDKEKERLKLLIKRRESIYTFMGVLALIAVPLLFLLSKADSAVYLLVVLIVFFVCLGISYAISDILSKEIRELQSVDENRLSIIQSKASKLYNRKCAEWGMSECPFHFEHSNYWVDDDTLCIVEDEETYLSHYTPDDIKPYPIYVTEIPIDRIQYFTKEGDVQYTSNVSGGGGGGSSLSGAIVGGLIAGDAGAVIGSRKKTAPIKTEIQTHDTRQTVLRYYDDFGKLEVMTFKGFSAYDFLLSAIPDKDLTTIQLGGNSRQKRPSTDTYSSVPSPGSNNTESKLSRLQDLYLDGQITLEEYKAQRAKILNKQ